MTTDSSKAAGDTVHPVSGELTFDTVPELYKTAGGWFAAGTAVTVDLAGVTRTDSAGLALLIEWVRAARQGGGGLRFDNVPAQVQNLIRANGLQDALLGPKTG